MTYGAHIRMIKFIASLCLLIITLNAYAEDCVSVAGSGSYGKISLPCVSGAGNLELKGTHIDGHTYAAGTLSATGANLNKLNVSGDGEITKTIVNGTTTVSGSLLATHSTLNKVSVSGSLQLENSTIKEGGDISGSLEANDSTILGPLTISSDKVRFDKTKTQSLKMGPRSDSLNFELFGMEIWSNKDRAQTVYLSDSTVNGDINFTSGKGFVYLKGDSKITGAVHGGITKHI